ncbi:uncharacterized protein RHIMIDRAFT_243843 [Rhizopus microsporus ATCC 52813]|uniref:Mid2 domain-containing protein n=1 Tax=Rhizopus microsporus ATCC 52813 TaxID=1340429 RepID=A0A2G4T9Y8_RHIZD|nr:uncharacterized protein RHIMIDRAFT_243843 [Rhizopus microsporus ATCC 52813]PHZ17832.1 hypothetical protein RHIMIDRAFT_243843 [Rhizopus microsporus ATCC 52813]
MFNWTLIYLLILIQATQGSIAYTSYPAYTSSVDLQNADFSGLYATNKPTTASTNAAITSGSSSTVTVTTLLSTSSKQPEKLSATDSTVIIGGSIAGVVVVLILTACVCFITMRRRRARQPKHFNSKSMLFLNANQPPFTMVSQEKEQMPVINTTPTPRRRDQPSTTTIPNGARLSKYNYLSEAFSQMRSTDIGYSKPSLAQPNATYNTNNIMDNNNSNSNNSNNNNNIPPLSLSSTAVKLPERDPTIDAYFKKNFDIAPLSRPPVSHPSASHLSVANSSISDVSKYSAILRPYMQQSPQTYNNKYQYI